MKNRTNLVKINMILNQLNILFQKGDLNKNQFNMRIDLLKELVDKLDTSESTNTHNIVKEFKNIQEETMRFVYGE